MIRNTKNFDFKKSERFKSILLNFMMRLDIVNLVRKIKTSFIGGNLNGF